MPVTNGFLSEVISCEARGTPINYTFAATFWCAPPRQKVSDGARRHPVSLAQRKKILSSAQEAHFACENAGWRRTLEALIECGQAGRRRRDEP